MEKSQSDFTRRYADGRLHTRPLAPTIAPDLDAGSYLLSFDNGLQAQIHVPPGYRQDRPLPLLTIFHGAYGLDGGAVGLASAWAKRHGALLIAQKSHAASWDLLRGAYGVDLAFTDCLLAWSMQRYAIDAARIGIAGFSDGASYALSVGLGNGDLFSDILAFSPGFMRPSKRVGRPRIYIAHGSGDQVLPVDCGRRIAGQLAEEEYDVYYDEFDGGHTVPPAQAEAALRRFAKRP
jgi:predicted esterase